MVNTTPLEEVEQANFVDWLELQGLKFSATAQSTYTTSYNQKRKNHRTGLRKGVPDMIVLIAPEQSKDGEGYCIFIELKRLKGGKVSPEQQSWLDALNQTPVHAYLAQGCDAAIKIVEHYLKEPKGFKF